ncbi:hypothetical protein CONLIGDRAFT_686883 [Coniochaeta ligniaria NRRL 30616]|uniref:Uncharacterized protein n=1 Tax=Coniochaeta ligniaria NRRL 30616 TaxID=1408157 RepID=A0A1J7I6H0_9PEZI|nr:hypothetical protein CONLIGDRAFT_686883 [Coniochaeta ligniaria NRRL 30616]
MANQPKDQADGSRSQSGQSDSQNKPSDSQNSQNMAHPRPEKLGVNLSTIRYLDESVTSLHATKDNLMEITRTQMGQNEQLATKVDQSATPRAISSPSTTSS